MYGKFFTHIWNLKNKLLNLHGARLLGRPEIALLLRNFATFDRHNMFNIPQYFATVMCVALCLDKKKKISKNLNKNPAVIACVTLSLLMMPIKMLQNSNEIFLFVRKPIYVVNI